MTAFDVRVLVLGALCHARSLPESAERTTTLDHLRFAARALLTLVQTEEDEAMRAHLRDRDTLPAPAPESERDTIPSDVPSDIASHWSLTHE